MGTNPDIITNLKFRALMSRGHRSQANMLMDGAVFPDPTASNDNPPKMANPESLAYYGLSGDIDAKAPDNYVPETNVDNQQ